ncbi:MAG: RNA methyltransferase [Candidatus Cloacimonetes bacterium]|nr:RNA methyltransferase [Candidatus Cloacimonadota bacterium]
MAKANIYIGLVHYPVYNKQREIVTTSITNMDIHDISRTCMTYGVRNYLVINPLISQRELFNKIVKFWHSEIGKKYQGDRAIALGNINFCSTLIEAKEFIKNQEGFEPIIITTTAKDRIDQIGYDAYPTINKEQKPIFLIFGTGYGLADELHQSADFILQSISGAGEYNHLSVRSAVAIILDRMLPKNKGGKDGFSSSS